MPDTREAAVKLAAIKAVQTAAKEAEAETKAWLEDHLDPGDRKGATVGDDSVGTVSYSKTSPTAKITNPTAFLEWVTVNHPEQLRRRCVVSAYDLEGLLDPTGWAAEYRAECEERLRRAMLASDLEVEPGYATKILADTVRNKAPVNEATGEMIPGITYVPASAGSIAIRQSDGQRQALVDAYARGDLDLLELATTPLALEEAR